MDTKWRNYSHSIVTKIITFVMVITCFTGVITSLLNIALLENNDIKMAFQESYFHSVGYMSETNTILRDLKMLTEQYKSEEHILNGGSISEDEMRNTELELFYDFQNNSKDYNPNLSEEENYDLFKEVYADKISKAKEKMIKEELRQYHLLLKRIENYKGILYYISDGSNIYKNTTNISKEYFKSHPSYMIFENYEQEVYPVAIFNNRYYYWIASMIDQAGIDDHVMYIAFTEDFINPRIEQWKSDKVIAANSLYRLGGFLLGLIVSFLYLIWIIGRRSFRDQEVHLNVVDKLYNDINFGLCLGLIMLWFLLLDGWDIRNYPMAIIPITVPIATAGLILVLSLIKHFKNRTFIKHSLVFRILYSICQFIKKVYDSGSLGVKVVLLVIGYPILVGITIFIFPVTIGAAAWLALKKIKEFNAIKEGVEIIKNGDIQHTIEIDSKGEFKSLADNINSITDGLKNAVENELKSERLKTELITNVSHDIRTPLTGIITYVGLLKKETDPSKVQEYIEVLDQRAQRLKVLTDDLFEAAKASSGNIPTNLEKINIVSLITQGLGELNDKIEASQLDFKINHPKEAVYIKADGRLFWRAVENLLSNIFKYALQGSRVYIDIEDLGNEVLLTFKNISAYELNISADELMERFKRGDESRSSQGSGLGLSIAKSLIDIQKGRFNIQVDGDLFKAMIYMPKYNE